MGKQTQPIPLKQSERSADFQIFTRELEITKSASAGDGKTRIKCIASSSIEDRHGDTITEQAIASMKKQATGLTIFRNHAYSIPDDVFGYVEKATVKKMTAAQAKEKGLLPEHIATTGKGNDTYAFLELDVVVDETNDFSRRTLASMENGVTLGVSIGAMILDYEEKEGYEGSWFPPLIINDVELLEASIVGIPANPLSWVEGATKAVAVSKGVLGKRASREDLDRMLTRANSPEERELAREKEMEPTGEPPVEHICSELCDGDTHVLESVEGEEAPVVEAAVEPNEQFSSPAEIVEHYRVLARDEESDISLNENELRILLADELQGYLNTRPDEEQVANLLAAVMEDRPLEADTTKDATTDSTESDDAEDTDAQEATEEGSDPETAEGTDPEAAEKAQAEVQQLLEAGILTSLTDAADLLTRTLTQLVEAQNRSAALEAENEELRGQLQIADANVLAAVDFVNKLMDLPLARKATVQAEVKAFSSNLEAVYGKDLIKLFTQNGKG